MTDEERRIWEAKIADYHASGLTAQEWCDANGEQLNRLKYRIKVINKARKANSAMPTRWLPVTVDEPDRDHTGLSIKVGTASIEVRPGFDRDLLKDVVRVLASC